MVRREIWGYFLTHYALTALICTAATNAGIDPDRVKFKRAIGIIRRADDPAFPPDQRQRLLDRVMAGIAGPRKLNEKRERSYPRRRASPAQLLPGQEARPAAYTTMPPRPSNSSTLSYQG
jgi:hypothetical protein